MMMDRLYRLTSDLNGYFSFPRSLKDNAAHQSEAAISHTPNLSIVIISPPCYGPPQHGSGMTFIQPWYSKDEQICCNYLSGAKEFSGFRRGSPVLE